MMSFMVSHLSLRVGFNRDELLVEVIVKLYVFFLKTLSGNYNSKMKNSINDQSEKFSENSRNPKTENNEIFLQNLAKEKVKNLKNESDAESPGEESRLLSGKLSQYMQVNVNTNQRYKIELNLSDLGTPFSRF